MERAFLDLEELPACGCARTLGLARHDDAARAQPSSDGLRASLASRRREAAPATRRPRVAVACRSPCRRKRELRLQRVTVARREGVRRASCSWRARDPRIGRRRCLVLVRWWNVPLTSSAFVESFAKSELRAAPSCVVEGVDALVAREPIDERPVVSRGIAPCTGARATLTDQVHARRRRPRVRGRPSPIATAVSPDRRASSDRARGTRLRDRAQIGGPVRRRCTSPRLRPRPP